jgi:hypothetical protein
MIAGIIAGQALGGAGLALGSTNIMRDGSVSSIAIVGPYVAASGAAVNDNIFAEPTYYVVTGGSTAGQNNTSGVEVTFTRSLALGRFVMTGYGTDKGITYNCQVDYWNGSAWVSAGSAIAAISGSTQTLDFNIGGGISSTKWRYRLNSWTSGGSNFRAYELQAYEWV